MRKIGVVTGTRADYGILYWVMKEIQADASLELQTIVTAMHLSPEFGLTYHVIENDGFPITAKVEMLVSSDTPVGIAKSVGLGIIGFADALDRLRPDILLLLGDRFEILAAAQAAMIARIPIAHIAGGDTTEGAVDESIRHAMTKMAHIHLVTNEVAAGRVRQLGENPSFIFNVGSPGIDTIRRTRLLDRKRLEEALGFEFGRKTLLVTFHPSTLSSRPADAEFRALLDALDQFGNQVRVIFTKPNADAGGRILIEMIDQFVADHRNAKAFTSLGQELYLSTMSHVDVIVGNSSSGLYEAPSFQKPTVNIGDRQKGRLQAASVIQCDAETPVIVRAIKRAFVMDCTDVKNPYGDGNSAPRIVNVIKHIADPAELLQKHFFEVGEQDG